MARGNAHPNTSGLKRTAGPGRPAGSKNKLTIARVEEEIRRIATLDPIAFFVRYPAHQRGPGRFRFTLRELAEMPPEARACIASVKVKTENLTAGDDQQDQTVEIKLWNKIDALTLCAKHFGWIDERATVNVQLDAEIMRRLKGGQADNAKPRPGEGVEPRQPDDRGAGS